MVTAEQILETITDLDIGEGFEVGDLFHRLPGQEKVFWRLVEKTGVKVLRYKFTLHYYGVHIRTETLTVRNGELKTGA